jgi:hypothetical protein
MSEVSTITEYVLPPDPADPGIQPVLSLVSTITEYVLPPGPADPGIQPVLSLEDLLNDHSIILQKEINDKTLLLVFFDKPIEQLKPKLLEWAKAGLPDLFLLDSIQITPPGQCSDGVSRDFLGYIQWVAELQFPELLQLTQKKLSNIFIAYSFTGNILRLHCSRP